MATGAARRIACAIGPAVSIAADRRTVDLGVEQIVLVSAAPESPGPHALAAPRLDGRGRLGEYLQSSEAAVVRDATAATHRAGPRIFTDPARRTTRSVRSISPAASTTARIAGSDSAELMSRGYEDAYHQFIEPVVGAQRRAGLAV